MLVNVINMNETCVCRCVLYLSVMYFKRLTQVRNGTRNTGKHTNKMHEI